MRFFALICAGLVAAAPAVAQNVAQDGATQGRQTLGFGRIFTNDFLGDNDDRWRTGSYAFSIVRGPSWGGQLPTAPGAILEYRLRSEIIAPGSLNGTGSDDRAYVGALSAGVHTHFNRGGANISAGIDLVATGPQTGIADLQDQFHDIVGAPNLSNTVIANQIANAVHPTALAELSYPITMNETTTLRPFVEAQIGVENFVRVGADVLIGDVLQQDLWLRDSPSGQLYSGVEQGTSGLGFVIGADYAVIGDSAYFPASFGTTAEDERLRARAGVHWRTGDSMSYFYGVTYLSEEFEGQTQGQIVGSVKLNFNF